MKDYVLVTFFIVLVTGFLIFPGLSKTIEIDVEDAEDYLSLSFHDSQKIIISLLEKIALLWTNLISSGHSDPDEQAVVVIIKKAIRSKIVSYSLIELPKEVGKNILMAIYKVAVFVYSPNQTYFLLDQFEKMTVEKAKEYATNWFFQKEIKTAVGNLPVNYDSYSGEKIVATLPYVIVYRPTGVNIGEMGVAIYSSGELSSPSASGDPWSSSLSDFWFGNDGEPIPPFILQIKGNVEKSSSGYYSWMGDPEINIEFPDHVPELKFSEPTLKNRITKEVEQRLVVIKKVGEVAGKLGQKASPDSQDFFKKIEQITNAFVARIRSFLSGSYLFSGMIVPPNLTDQNPEIIAPEDSIQVEQLEEQVIEEVLEQDIPQVESIPEQMSGFLEEIIEVIVPEPEPIVEVVEQPVLEQEDLVQEDVQEEQVEQIEICQKSGSAAQNKVIFNEVAWMGTENSSNDEWIELKNISGELVNLNNWQILDNGNQIEIIFEEYAFSSQTLFLLERTDDTTISFQQADLIYTGSLGNSNESLYLFNENCELQDEVSASPEWLFGDNRHKKTMEREDDLDWHTSVDAGGTPKSVNSVPVEGLVSSGGGGAGSDAEEYCYYNGSSPSNSPVVINEIAWMGTQSSENEWIELKNISGETVSLDGWQISDKDSDTRKRFDSSHSINSGQFFVLEKDNDDTLSGVTADLIYTGLIQDIDDTIYLFDQDCNLIDMVQGTPDWPAGDSNTKQTMEREDDLDWHTSVDVGGTPGQENSVLISYCTYENLGSPSYSPVVINEIAWMGTEDSYTNEWIELKNISGETVSLDGWQVSDADFNINEKLSSLSVTSGEFILLERTDDDSVAGVEADLIYTGGIDNTNETLYLFDQDCNLIDMASADSDWSAGDNDTKQTMEREDDLDWHTSVDVGGTPRDENSVPTLNESFDWQQAQKDYFRRGRVSVSGPLNTDNVQIGFSDTSVVDMVVGDQGTMFVASTSGIYSLDSSFNQKWFYELENPVSLVGGPNGNIYVLKYGLTALDQSGNELWKYNLSSDLMEQRPVITEDSIYIINNCLGYPAFFLFKFDLSGNLLWTFNTETNITEYNPEYTCAQSGFSSGAMISYPSVDSNENVYFGDNDNLFSLASDGNFRWKTNFISDPFAIGSSSIGLDGKVYMSQDYPKVLDPDTGETVWEMPWVGKKSQYGPSIGSDGTLYFWVFNSGSRIYAVNPNTQQPVWIKYLTNSYGLAGSLSSILLADNAIYFAYNHYPNSMIIAFDYQGEEIWNISPIVGSSMDHLIMSSNGDLYGLGKKIIKISP